MSFLSELFFYQKIKTLNKHQSINVFNKHAVQYSIHLQPSQDVLGKSRLPPLCFHCGPIPETREPH